MKINRWQRAWIVFSLIWLAYWLWVTWGMSFDSGDIPFVVRVFLAPPLLLYVVGWLVARVIRRMPSNIAIRDDLRPGDLGRIVSLHGETYDPLGGYGLRFEAYVARTIAEYVLDNDARGRIWMAEQYGKLVGCTAIALRDDDAAQLRWVVVAPVARGEGLGGTLVDKALEFCRSRGCASVYLFTTDGLPESQALYEKLGFEVTSNEIEELWDGERPLIRMQLDLV